LGLIISISQINVFRREIIQTILFMAFNSVDVVLAHSYLNVSLLLVYGTMWWLNMRFDSSLFVMSYSLLTYTRNASMNPFSMGVREVINYLAAQKRIRVISKNHIIIIFKQISYRDFCYSTSVNEIIV
jgi:hypothetical protein